MHLAPLDSHRIRFSTWVLCGARAFRRRAYSMPPCVPRGVPLLRRVLDLVLVRGGWGRVVSICRACCRQLVAPTAHATPRSARAHRGALALEQAGTSRRELLPVLRATRVMMGVLSSVPRRSGRGALAAADCPRPRSCQSGRRKVRHAAQAANQHKPTEGPLVPSPA